MKIMHFMVNIFSVWYFSHLRCLNNFSFNEMNKIQKIAETGLQCYAEMWMIFIYLYKTRINIKFYLIRIGSTGVYDATRIDLL